MRQLHTKKENVISESPSTAFDPQHHSSDVQKLRVDGREFILVGTAHVSQESVALVQEVITNASPDRVCVELDPRRYAALSEQHRWENLNLKEIIRQRQLSPLLAGLILSAYQKRLGGQLGVMPGTELVAATQVAKQLGIPIELCDRDVRVTLGRAWRCTPLVKKLFLLSSLLRSFFETQTVSEASLRQLRQQDVLSLMLEELGEALPSLRRVLIDERDLFMAQRLREAKGDRIVAVVGAAHVNGIRHALLQQHEANLERLNEVPPVSPVWRGLQWAIPALILGSLAFIGWQKGPAVAGHNALYWTLANGIPTAVGAAAALAHPLTVLIAFVAAPITSLTPIIGAGYVTAMAQAWMQPPTVRELQTVADDVRRVKMWWRNRLLRVFLAFLFPSLGSMLGTWIGGYKIASTLF